VPATSAVNCQAACCEDPTCDLWQWAEAPAAPLHSCWIGPRGLPSIPRPGWISQGKKASTPSFLFLLGDDIGWADFSYNNGTAMTPNIDAWAKRAGTVVFHDFHSAGTVCSPTRASVLTGRNPVRDCVDDVYGCSDPTECTPDFEFAPTRTFTIADAVRTAQVQAKSHHFGKWHLGSFYNDSELYGGRTSSPITHGFDHFNSTIEVAPTSTPNCGCKAEWSSQCKFGHNQHYNHCQGGANPGGSDLKPGCCFNYWWESSSSSHGIANLTTFVEEDDSTYIADSFGRFLKSRDGQPFLAQLSFHNCHIPYEGMSEKRELCKSGETCRSSDGHGRIPSNFSNAQLDYFVCLQELDASVGRILKDLETEGYYDNTMVWFTTDNGPEGNCYPTGQCQDGHFRNYPGSAGPLRGRKRDVWEGGHRVPGIISFPAVVKGPARESWDLATTSDFLPTIMDVLAVSRPEAQQHWGLDGVSLMPVLQGEMVPDREMGWLMGFQHGFPPWAHAYRSGKWKYVNGSKGCGDPSCHTDALFDLGVDLGETNDVAHLYPEILAAIKANFSRWFDSVSLSRTNESLCGTPSPPSPPFPPSLLCDFQNSTGVASNDLRKVPVDSKEDCCGLCREQPGCAAAVYSMNQCHMKKSYVPTANITGSVAVVPVASGLLV